MPIRRNRPLEEDEREEVLVKRCWLSRYWGLASHYGTFPLEMARWRLETWIPLAPFPLELLISIGEKTKEDLENQGNGGSERSKLARFVVKDTEGKLDDFDCINATRGLRDIKHCQIEENVWLKMRNQRSPGGDLEISEEEADDIRFKRAWLIYFWRKAVIYKLEEDIAKERLQYWISHKGSATLQDAVDAQRDMEEMEQLLLIWRLRMAYYGSQDIIRLPISQEISPPPISQEISPAPLPCNQRSTAGQASPLPCNQRSTAGQASPLPQFLRSIILAPFRHCYETFL